MNTIRVILVAGGVAVAAGCQSEFSRMQREDLQSKGWDLETIQTASAASNVIMVCVYESYLEKKPPGHYHLHHFKGTVGRSYKGTWQVSERINFCMQIEGRPPDIATNARAGRLICLFTNFHETEEFGCDTGEFWWYDPHLERDLDYLFPHPRRAEKISAIAP